MALGYDDLHYSQMANKKSMLEVRKGYEVMSSSNSVMGQNTCCSPCFKKRRDKQKT